MLTFNLKKEWFEKIKSGEKTHEYRELKPYWATRLAKYLNQKPVNGDYIPVDNLVMFRCGYNGARMPAFIKSVKIVHGLYTDLKTENKVFDVEFKLITFDDLKNIVFYSTTAVSEAIAYFRKLSSSYSDLVNKMIYLPDEKAIVEWYEAAGVPYSEFNPR